MIYLEGLYPSKVRKYRKRYRRELFPFRLFLPFRDFIQRIHQSLVEVDFFQAGEAQDAQHQVAQFLGIGLVLLGGEVGLFPAVLGQVGAGHFAHFLDQP